MAVVGYDKNMKRIYLDHAAATPMDESVARTVAVAARRWYANPSALHTEGGEARTMLEEARGNVAGVLSAHADEIVFVSSATEANNMALRGIVYAARARGIARPHIIVSAIEHPSVLETARSLAGEDARVDILPVDHRGLVDVRELRKRITPETILVSVMYANNEVGTIEPLREIGKEVRHARKMYASTYPYFHTDASQAANYLDLNILRLGVDLMTLSSSKTYGPRGIGVLMVRRGVNLVPLFSGGAHERGRRPGTEAVALALGFAEALAHAEKIKAKESVRVKKLRDALAERVLKAIPGASINGDLACALPNILNISITGCDSEALVIYLNAAGIAVSGGSACKSSSGETSYVLAALARGRDRTAGAIRFSLGRGTARADITCAVKELTRTIEIIRTAQEKGDR